MTIRMAVHVPHEWRKIMYSPRSSDFKGYDSYCNPPDYSRPHSERRLRL